MAAGRQLILPAHETHHHHHPALRNDGDDDDHDDVDDDDGDDHDNEDGDDDARPQSLAPPGTDYGDDDGFDGGEYNDSDEDWQGVIFKKANQPTYNYYVNPGVDWTKAFKYMLTETFWMVWVISEAFQIVDNLKNCTIFLTRT